MREEDYHCIHDWTNLGRHWIERIRENWESFRGTDEFWQEHGIKISMGSKQAARDVLTKEEIDYIESEYANVSGG